MPPTERWPFRPDHALLLRLRDEPLLVRLGREPEHDVHHRAALLLDRAAVERAVRVDGAVEPRRLLAVPRLDRRRARRAPSARRARCGSGRCRTSAACCRATCSRRACGAGRSSGCPCGPASTSSFATITTTTPEGPMFFCAPGVDEPEARDVERAPEEVARHVGDERRAGDRGERARRVDLELHAVDGLVRGDVHVRRARGRPSPRRAAARGRSSSPCRRPCRSSRRRATAPPSMAVATFASASAFSPQAPVTT